MLLVAEVNMRRIFSLVAIIICLSGLTVAQSKQSPASTQNPQGPPVTNRQIAELPLAKRSFRPRLTLQQALKLAESYIEKEKIEISPYFLKEARMIQYGGEKDERELRWFFWWVHENGVIGDYVEITVSMGGQVTHHPSM
jgi:hypothetical protein